LDDEYIRNEAIIRVTAIAVEINDKMNEVFALLMDLSTSFI
jgi:hypothetical protein